MSVILRHKKFPLVMMYKDPKKSWNSISKKFLLKEMEKEGFDNFTIIDEETAKVFFGFKIIKKKAKKKKERQKMNEKYMQSR